MTDLGLKIQGVNTCSFGHVVAERARVACSVDNGAAAAAFDVVGVVVFELVANEITGRVPEGAEGR